MASLRRLRPQPDDRLHFLRGFLSEPQKVGSIIPSSRFLERRLVDTTGARTARTVVELGPGTGGTTRALLRAMPKEGTLLAIELNDRFAELLERDADPRLRVHRGSAADLAAILAAEGLPAPDAVVSGIPFSTMPRALGRSILEAIHASLAPGGVFVAYQVRDRVGTLGRGVFGEPETHREFRNIPPLQIFAWRKQGSRA